MRDRAVGLAGVMGGVDSEVERRHATHRPGVGELQHEVGPPHRPRAEAAHRRLGSLRARTRPEPGARRRPREQPVSSSTSPPGRQCRRLPTSIPSRCLPRPLSLPFAEIERLLGVRYDPEQVLDVLSRLGFAPTIDGDGDAATLSLIVPTWRSDVTLAADVVEEVARVIGYETLPERLPTGQTAPVQRDPVYVLQRAVRSVLTGAGGWETVTYIAISDDDLRRLDPDGERTAGCPSGGPVAH